MSSEVKVMSKQAVFGGQVGEDDVRLFARLRDQIKLEKVPCTSTFIYCSFITSSLNDQPLIYIYELSAVRQVKLTCCIDQVTNKISEQFCLNACPSSHLPTILPHHTPSIFYSPSVVDPLRKAY